MEKAARERGSPFVSPTKVCETKKNDSCVYGKGGVIFKGTDKGGLQKMDQKTLQEITLIDRTGTNSTKWDDLRASFGEDGFVTRLGRRHGLQNATVCAPSPSRSSRPGGVWLL